MLNTEAKIFPLFNPAYLKGYRELTDWESRIRLKRKVQDDLVRHFGEIVDPDNRTVGYKPFHELDLFMHCGEVSEITRKTVGGEIREKIVKGRNVALYFINSFGKEEQIAFGSKEAMHFYVVDVNQQVWDPITRMWGTVSEAEYLKRISRKKK